MSGPTPDPTPDPTPEPKPPDPTPDPTPPKPTFPKFVRPLITILLTVFFIGGYIVLFARGLWLGVFDDGEKNWPTADEDAQAVLTAVGGIAATLFAVALNLPDNASFGSRAASTIGLRKLPGWDTIDRVVLVVFGTALVLCYVPFSIIGFFATIARAEADVPSFVANFAGPGFGILLTAFLIHASGLTRPR